MKIVGHILIPLVYHKRDDVLKVPPIRPVNLYAAVCNRPSQADTRSMSQWESCVTEVKIEAQAISGGCLALWFLVFPFRVSLFSFPVSHMLFCHTASPFFEAGAIVYDGLTEQFCIHPLSLLPSSPSPPCPAPPQNPGYKRALCAPVVRHDRSVIA